MSDRQRPTRLGTLSLCSNCGSLIHPNVRTTHHLSNDLRKSRVIETRGEPAIWVDRHPVIKIAGRVGHVTDLRRTPPGSRCRLIPPTRHVPPVVVKPGEDRGSTSVSRAVSPESNAKTGTRWDLSDRRLGVLRNNENFIVQLPQP